MPLPAAVAAAAKAWAATRSVRSPDTRGRVIVAATVMLGVAVALPMTGTIIAIAGTRDPGTAGNPTGVVVGIPAEALGAYRDAAQRWQMDWAILAGIGKLECDHGRSQLPGCTPPDTINSAGARGYMQFIGSTWRRGLGQHQLEPRTSPPAPDGQGYATDGDGDGHADPWSWPDAAHSAARYLTANGVNRDPRQAVWRYNHDDNYVTRVLQIAATYLTTTVAAGRYEGTPGNVPLATIECPTGGTTTVHAQLAPSAAAMYQAAAATGIHLCGGGYRDPQLQIELRRAHCGTSDFATYQMPASQCSPPTARPGTSMHERGLAIDLTCDGELITNRANACYQWLDANAAEYGLHELATGQEPWHWSTSAA